MSVRVLELIIGNDIGDYIRASFLFFLISIAIQTPFFVVFTVYFRRIGMLAKTALIIPFAAGTVAPAAGLQMLFDPELGLFPFAWLSNSVPGGFLLVGAIDAWQWTGVLLLLSIICIERIPLSNFHQATLEGMSDISQWRYIIWPSLRKVLLAYTIIKALDWMRKFEVIKLLFGNSGGHGGAFKTFIHHTSNKFFDYGMAGYAITLSLLQLLVLVGCFVLIFSLWKVPDAGSEKLDHYDLAPERGRTVRRSFFVLAVVVIGLPMLWLLSMSIQPTSVLFVDGYKLIPVDITLENYALLFDFGSRGLGKALLYSAGFFMMVSCVSLLFAVNETFQIATETDIRRKRSGALIIIGLFFLPIFSFYAAIEEFDWVKDNLEETTVLFVFSVVQGFAIGFLILFSIYFYYLRSDYEQFLLESGSRAYAFARAILLNQPWAIYLVFVFVFSTVWNELFINDKWTTTAGWRPFSVEIGQGIQQLELKYSLLASGAIVSVLVPLVAAFLIYLTAQLTGILQGALRGRYERNGATVSEAGGEKIQ